MPHAGIPARRRIAGRWLMPQETKPSGRLVFQCRVGGGFEYSHSARYPAALVNSAAYQTYRALPAVSTPLTVDDVLVVSLILRHAEAAGVANSSQPVRVHGTVSKPCRIGSDSVPWSPAGCQKCAGSPLSLHSSHIAAAGVPVRCPTVIPCGAKSSEA